MFVQSKDKLPADLVIPYGVTKIENGAFSGCTSLASVVIPDSVTEIGYVTEFGYPIVWSKEHEIGGAFEGCTSLKSVSMPKSVTKIGDYAFKDCVSLVSVKIPDGVTVIGRNAFFCCTSLRSVTIPDSVTRIDSEAFSGCTSLSKVTIPDNVKEIRDRVFQDCMSLKSITIPHGVKYIGSSLTEISGSAFHGCKNLKILYDGTKAQWKEIYKNPVGVGSKFVVHCKDGSVIIE